MNEKSKKNEGVFLIFFILGILAFVYGFYLGEEKYFIYVTKSTNSFYSFRDGPATLICFMSAFFFVLMLLLSYAAKKYLHICSLFAVVAVACFLNLSTISERGLKYSPFLFIGSKFYNWSELTEIKASCRIQRGPRYFLEFVFGPRNEVSVDSSGNMGMTMADGEWLKIFNFIATKNRDFKVSLTSEPKCPKEPHADFYRALMSVDRH